MHNLAIALQKKGYNVSGSDDEIFEPAYSRLKNLGLLPESIGWYPEKISDQLDAVILGMHAKDDNPELLEAKRLGVKIFSYPEYLFEQSKDKVRIVVGGSHGKTTITAMILHVMKDHGIDTDYMVGAQLEGFDVMVKLSKEAEYMVFEGDEYLTSAIDRRPKFHLYQPHIAVISGIAWDHINVFPTFDNYVDQFRIFANMVPSDGTLIYCEEDNNVVAIASALRNKINCRLYGLPEHSTQNGITYIHFEGENIPLRVFGDHNLMNLEAARKVLELLGINALSFYKSISSFKGAAKRLELISSSDKVNVYKDFAHSPSKLKATTDAVRAQFPQRKLIACMELHTFSSLNTEFLEQYKGSMDNCTVAVVYYNRHALELKRLPYFDKQAVIEAFGRNDIHVFNEIDALTSFVEEQVKSDCNILMMSSGNFEGLDLKQFAEKLIKKVN